MNEEFDLRNPKHSFLLGKEQGIAQGRKQQKEEDIEDEIKFLVDILEGRATDNHILHRINELKSKLTTLAGSQLTKDKEKTEDG